MVRVYWQCCKFLLQEYILTRNSFLLSYYEMIYCRCNIDLTQYFLCRKFIALESLIIHDPPSHAYTWTYRLMRRHRPAVWTQWALEGYWDCFSKFWESLDFQSRVEFLSLEFRVWIFESGPRDQGYGSTGCSSQCTLPCCQSECDYCAYFLALFSGLYMYVLW